MPTINTAAGTQSTEMWYVQRSGAAISLIDTPGPNIALMLGVMQFPSSPMLWNVPAYQPLRQDFTQLQNLCLLSGITMPPFASITSQLPITAYRPFLGQLAQGENLNILSSQDVFFGAAGQPPQIILSSPPVGYPVPPTARTHINVQSPGLLDRFFGSDGEPPTYQPPPNPVIAVPNVQLLSWMQGIQQNLLNRDALFSAAGEVLSYTWIVPLGYVFPISLRTFLQQVQQTLIGQDTILGVAGQPLPYIEFITPRAIAFPYENRGILISEETPLVLIVPAPVVVPPTTPTVPAVVVVPAKGINEVELGYALIRRFMELFRSR